jgi:hypothetical protein
METVVGSWLTTGLAALAILLLLVVTVALLPRVMRTAAFYCPWARRRVVLRYLLDEEWRPLRVVGCTALEEGAVSCGARCLREGGPPDVAETDRAVVGASRP